MTSTTPTPTRRLVPALVIYTAAVVAVAGIGGLATAAGQGADGWYDGADKPFFTPPGAVFGPVWTVLYAGLVLTAWRLSRVRAQGGPTAPEASAALRLWWLQLAANFLWTPLFFAAEWLWVGLVDIVVLDVLVILLLRRAWRADRLAAVPLLPYLAWILFATALTASVAWLNQPL